MKKFIAILLIAVLALSMVACGDTYTDIVEQLEDMDYSGYFYTTEQITAFTEDEGIMESMSAFANFSSIEENGVERHLYVASFKTEKDAKSYLDNRTAAWKYAFISGRTVVYGNDSAINDLDL